MKTAMNYNDAKRYVRSFSTVRYVEERPFIIAIVELQDVSSEEAGRSDKPQRLMLAKGLSTCSPTDKWNSERGRDVARGRAEAKLARRVMRQMTKATAQEVKSALMPTLDEAVSKGVISVSSDVIIDGENYYQV